MTNETIEVDREALEHLVSFVETHGVEYADPASYLAARDALRALGEDRDPAIVWRSSWGEKPEADDA